VGGWGLGAGHEDIGKPAEEEEEDEPLDWDQAQVGLHCWKSHYPMSYMLQAVVERMVGMTLPPEPRRRMT
jgi:hypothetical protein